MTSYETLTIYVRISVAIHPKLGELKLPKKYHRYLSATVWKGLDIPEEKESRLPCLMVMSPLIFRERVVGEKNIRMIGNEGKLVLASPLDNIIEAINGWTGVAEIAGNLVDVGRKDAVDQPVFEERMVWGSVAGSGICVRAEVEGKRKYISPAHPECESALTKSMQGKWRELCRRNFSKAVRWSESGDPVKWGEENPPMIKIVSYLNNILSPIKEKAWIVHWPGRVEVVGSVAWQRLVWDCGLGVKTGLGVGMVTPWKGTRNDS